MPVNKTGFNNKLKDVISNENELNELSKKVKAISTKELKNDLINKFSIFNVAKHFSLGILQNYLVFIPAKKWIKYFSGTSWIQSWKSSGIESIDNLTKSDSNFSLTFVDHHLLPETNFNGHCLTKNDISIPKKVINLYIFCTFGPQLRLTDFTLGNCLLGSVDLEFDSCSELLFKDGSYWKNIIFGADMSSSVHVYNKEKDIFILGERPTQRLDDTTLTAEAKYPINFTQSGKRFISSLHSNRSNSFLFINAKKYINSKPRTQKWKIMHCV